MSAAAHMRRVKHLERKIAQQRAPRSWCIELGEGEELPAVIAAKFRPGDEVTIRGYPCGFLCEREGNWTYGTVSGPGGAWIIRPDGSLERVVKR